MKNAALGNNKCAKPPAVRCVVFFSGAQTGQGETGGGLGLVISVTSCAILFRLHVLL